MTKSILIVDDDPFAVDGITRVLRGYYSVFAAHTVAEMLQILKTQRFDLVILDLNLGDDGSTIDYIRKIKDTGALVMILTTTVNLECVRVCFRLEVNGYVHKQEASEALLKKVQGVLEGHLMISQKLLLEATKPENELPPLGRRESELVELLFGQPLASNLELADMMNLSEGRIKNLFQAMFKKMGVHRRGELVQELRRRGYRSGMQEIDSAIPA